MFVVTKSGKKLPVDDSALDYEKDYVGFQDTVGLYTDNTILKPVWIVEMNRNNHWHDQSEARRGNVLEFVAEVRFFEEPTQEQILWAMAAHGLSRWDIAFVRKGFMLGMEGD